jgi:Ca2+-binding RTX toxin-like protein
MALIYGTNGSDVIDAQDGVTDDGDFIYSYGGLDVIYGLGGNDYIEGGDDADTIDGGSDDDRIMGGAGADAIDGGSGTDTASYYYSGTAVFVSLANGIAVGGDANGDTLLNIESISGSFHGDFLIGDDGANMLEGLDGDDILKGGGGADFLYGGEGNDTLRGGDGADFLSGSSGIDYLSGGAGDDRYDVDAGDIVSEAAGEGTDTVYSRAFSYTLPDNVEILSLAAPYGTAVYGTGNAQVNTVFGNVYDNVLEGGGAADVLSGLGGNDTFVFRPGHAHGDTIYEFNGNGAAAGDVLRFEGYGSIAQGATFRQFDATHWEIASADGLTHDIIILLGGPTLEFSDFVFA